MSEQAGVATQTEPDAGRPDATRLARLVLARMRSAAGLPASVTDGAVGSVTSTPRTAAELAPGDPASLRAAGTVLREAAELTGDPERGWAAASVSAHDELAHALVGLRARAEVVFGRAGELGVADVLLADAAAFARRRQDLPDSDAELVALAAEAVDVRLAWVVATQEFVDAHAGVREGLGIAAW